MRIDPLAGRIREPCRINEDMDIAAMVPDVRDPGRFTCEAPDVAGFIIRENTLKKARLPQKAGNTPLYIHSEYTSIYTLRSRQR